jgi:hypothetical protein
MKKFQKGAGKISKFQRVPKEQMSKISGGSSINYNSSKSNTGNHGGGIIDSTNPDGTPV